MAIKNEDNSGKLEQLEEDLYEREAKLPKVRHSALSKTSGEPAHDWRGLEAEADQQLPHHPHSIHMLKKIFWLALIIFVLSGLVTGFIFWRGSNVISPGNIEIKIDGPVSIRAGETVSLQLEITNRNNTALEFVDLLTEYPPGSRTPGESGAELSRLRETLGTIAPGGTVRHELRAVLFGERNSELSIDIGVEYRLVGSNAIFNKHEVYKLAISGSPLLLTMEVPPEVNSNQEVALNIEVLANAEAPVSGAIVAVDYPSGFTFARSTPAPTSGNNVWSLPNLNGGDKWQLRVIGKLEGQSDEEKTFRARAGMPAPANQTQVGALYGSDLQAVAIRRPPVTLSADINGEPGEEYMANSGQDLRLEIGWINNLPTAVTDGEVLVKLSGQALERSSVTVGRGFYQSNANTVIWNKNSDDSLEQIQPSETGQVSVTFNSVPLEARDNQAIREPKIDLLITFRGRRVTEDDSDNQFETEIKRTIKLNSVSQLSAKILHYSGSFTNEGPMPPQVEAETTYTAVWTVFNSTNDLKESKVTAVLPPYVRWLGEISPSSEDISFSEDASGGGTIIWNLGTVKAGTGYSLGAREVSFRLGLTPSLNQIGSSPNFMSKPQFTAVDNFTKQPLSTSFSRDLNTNLSADPEFRSNESEVVR